MPLVIVHKPSIYRSRRVF